MQIGEFATAAGTTPRMLRHYEDQGLLEPASRDANGYRRYEKHQVHRARQITDLLRAGLPSRLISGMLDALTDAGGIHPLHVDPELVENVHDEWERMCRCVDCMMQRRDALRTYLDELTALDGRAADTGSASEDDG